VIVIAIYHHLLEYFCTFWPVHAILRITVCISVGIQAFTLLVIFQLYLDEMFTKMNNFLYTRIVNILSRCIIVIRNKRLLYITACINSYTLRMAWIVQNV